MDGTLAGRDSVIWMDGELVPWLEAKVQVLTHTLHYRQLLETSDYVF